VFSLIFAGALTLAATSPAAAPKCMPQAAPVVGTICTPNDGQKHPAIILLGGSEGGDRMAALAKAFAGHGYVGASVAYFGAPGTPSSLLNIPVETVGKALQTLTARSDVEASKIAILGASKGGEFALLAASTYPQIRAVIAYVPSPFAWFGFGANGIPSGCSWSKNGQPLPCVSQDPSAGQQIGQMFMQHQPISFRASYDESRKNEAAVKAAFFPLERINGPVLCLAGQDDQMWNSPAQCDSAMTYLHDHHHAYNDRTVTYPNAGHMFMIAYNGPKSAMNSVNTGSVTILFGGTPQGDANAAAAAWPAIYTFLASALGK
jgi:dienelactone hydrolase